jgi:ubiquinone/menaquinone biosynthesis C-methylase UbiE
MKNNKEFLSGEKLYGDNFSLNEIKKWYGDEEEGYSGLIGDYESGYGYSQVNIKHGFSKLKNIKKFQNVLSFGGAKGDELIPIIDKIKKITIIEPSKKLRVKKIKGKGVNYVTPKTSGEIKLKNNEFDLITCFGTLHHIPNVSFVFDELVRVLKKGGFILLREPIVSMGDWTKPRIGLTKRERGIPEIIFKRLITKNKLKIVSRKKIMFPLLRRMNFKGKKGGNSKTAVFIDDKLSRIFSFNKKYHSTKFVHKLRPQSIFYVLQKNE